MTDASTTPPRSRRRKSVPALVGTVLTLVCVVFIVKALSSEWGEVHDDLTRASWWWLGAGLGFAALGMIAIAWVWADALRLVGGDVPRRKVVPWYFVGEIGKYIPGAVWAAVGHGEVAVATGCPPACPTRAWACRWWASTSPPRCRPPPSCRSTWRTRPTRASGCWCCC